MSLFNKIRATFLLSLFLVVAAPFVVYQQVQAASTVESASAPFAQEKAAVEQLKQALRDEIRKNPAEAEQNRLRLLALLTMQKPEKRGFYSPGEPIVSNPKFSFCKLLGKKCENPISKQLQINHGGAITTVDFETFPTVDIELEKFPGALNQHLKTLYKKLYRTAISSTQSQDPLSEETQKESIPEFQEVSVTTILQNKDCFGEETINQIFNGIDQKKMTDKAQIATDLKGCIAMYTDANPNLKRGFKTQQRTILMQDDNLTHHDYAILTKDNVPPKKGELCALDKLYKDTFKLTDEEYAADPLKKCVTESEFDAKLNELTNQALNRMRDVAKTKEEKQKFNEKLTSLQETVDPLSAGAFKGLTPFEITNESTVLIDLPGSGRPSPATSTPFYKTRWFGITAAVVGVIAVGGSLVAIAAKTGKLQALFQSIKQRFGKHKSDRYV